MYIEKSTTQFIGVDIKIHLGILNLIYVIISNFDNTFTKLINSSYADVIKTNATTLISKTDVEIITEYERLSECVAE